MEALSVSAIPEGDEWQYEPKWDGFRCIAFRNENKIELQSKAGRPLTRYFPELIAALKAVKAPRFVLDGEIVIPAGEKLSFDNLLQRLHPAASRIQKLSKQTPALFIVFDLLSDHSGKRMVRDTLKSRRKHLEAFARKHLSSATLIRLSPATTNITIARKWLSTVGASLDGVIAKRLDVPYQSGNRIGMQKIKKIRTVDCVIGGFRYAEGKPVVGSLLLGLYDDAGLLHHVGFTSGIKNAERPELTKRLEAIRRKPGFTGRAPGGQSRWSTERSGVWVPVTPKYVIEVEYDHFTGGRFRHGTKVLRWRPDKDPRQCHMNQVEQQASRSLRLLK